MNKPLMVFIAHPISGDVEGNTRKVLEICRTVHSEHTIPLFPRFTWSQYLSESDEDKKLAAVVAEAYFASGAVDELWVYGDTLTDGMKKEIELALKYGVLLNPMSEANRQEITEFVHRLIDKHS